MYPLQLQVQHLQHVIIADLRALGIPKQQDGLTLSYGPTAVQGLGLSLTRTYSGPLKTFLPL